ncbi:MAG: hypothetical protein H6657_31845 [Ardenticatenaceae bacterium]|nr:hypothetical protein [Ardenticatenaceae bacterium]
MMRLQRESNGRPQPLPRAATGPFQERLMDSKARVLTAVLANQSCYVQGDDAPLRYRLLTDTALRLAELNQLAAYFDLSDLAYQYDLTTWIQNVIRLLAIQLNLPLPTAVWFANHAENDPVDMLIQFLAEQVLPKVNQPVLLSFDEADQLQRAPLAADFWRLLQALQEARKHPAFEQFSVILWGKSSWQALAEDGRFPAEALKQIIL